MTYCPNCQKSFPAGDKFCPDCGNVLETDLGSGPDAGIKNIPQAEAQTMTGVVPQPNPFKNPIFWMIASGVVVVAAIVGGILLYLNSRSDTPAPSTTSTATTPTATTDSGVKAYQDNLARSWNTLRDITVELVKKDSEVVDQASLNAFSALLTVSADKTEQVRNEMGRLQVPDDYKLKHQNLIDAVGSYRDYLKALLSVTSQDPATVNAASFQPVNTLGEDVQKKVVASEKQLAFLKALPDECFILHTSLSTFYTAIWQKPQTQRPTPAPAPDGTAGIAADRGLTDATVGGFSDAYKGAEYSAMESYLYGSGWNFQFNYAVPPYSWEYGDATGQPDTVRIIYLFWGDGVTNILEDWYFQVGYANGTAMIIDASLVTRTDFYNN